MKIQIRLPLMVLYCCSLSLFTPVAAQETQIDGTTYETLKKETLNTDADFVKLKQKGGSASSGKSYIKVNSEYNKTSFKAAELKTFFTTGKLSSLGTVKKSKMAGKPLMYIDNGSAIVIVNYNKESIGFIEIHDEKIILSARNSFAKAYDDNQPGGTTGDPFLDCGVDCLNDYIACGNSATCKNSYRTCYYECKRKYPSRTGGANSSYVVPLNKLVVKL